MPFIANSKYNTIVPILHKNRHFSTIYAAKCKRFLAPKYKREKIELSDGDFLTIDYILQKTSKAVILCHGLEGHSQRTYINSCADYFLKQGYAAFAWNNRSCGGEMNRLPKLYHHATIEDLEAVVQFVISAGFQEIYLVGFSLGGGQVLNYFGRMKEIDDRIKGGVSVSVPVEVKAAADSLKKGFNQLYMKNFTKDLIKKLELKSKQFPDYMDWNKIKFIKDFDYLDDNFTAPMHGFIDRNDYYYSVSPARCIDNIRKPVLILNALNDSFLGEGCFPINFAKENSFVYLETPNYGGHCAFPIKNSNYSYAEIRAHEFFKSI